MRRTSEQLIAELDRLLACSEAIDSAFTIAGWGTCYRTDLGQWREGMLQLVAEKKVTLSQVVSGARESINDRNEQLLDLMEGQPALATQILTHYTAHTGRDYWDDAGHPKRQIKRILKRGRIRDETEFRFLNGILSNVDQKLLNEAEIIAANRLLQEFEDTTAV